MVSNKHASATGSAVRRAAGGGRRRLTAGRNVLISGAGVAGSTLAYWLARNGFKPTVVERSQGLRSSGNPVDVRGPVLPVVEAMGVVPSLRAAATRTTRMRLLNAAGRQVATVDMPGARGGEVEVPRADLAVTISASAAGAISAPPMPWAARAASSHAWEVAKPPASEAAENRPSPAANTRRRPSRSRPGRRAAAARRS